ncbi:MAG: hypothetical protein A2046_08365 [Bacteroidetes bacterium GWA2_30_7]|nr:MAG: hypothetical protein A2046_08365 [Bacteroidetes bacterium GWA2_30_7]
MYKNLLLTLISIFLFACNNSPESDNLNSDDSTLPELLNNSEVEAVIEVYNIHTSNPDSTSIEVGTYSKKTIERYFSKEKERGVVKFIDVNFDDSSNKELLKKFEINNPGLYIVCKKSEKESIENLTDFAFLTAVDEPEILMQAVKTNIEDKLKLNK